MYELQFAHAMKKHIFQPLISDESVIVQFTDAVLLDKTLTITVPNDISHMSLQTKKHNYA